VIASRDGNVPEAGGFLRVRLLAFEKLGCGKSSYAWEEAALLRLFWYVVFADGCAEAEFRNAAEHLSSDIGTARVVAQILGKFLFAAVWSCEARLNGYPRHGENPTLTTALCAGSRGHAQVTLG
jgi:hypothetical protein